MWNLNSRTFNKDKPKKFKRKKDWKNSVPQIKNKFEAYKKQIEELRRSQD